MMSDVISHDRGIKRQQILMVTMNIVCNAYSFLNLLSSIQRQQRKRILMLSRSIREMAVILTALISAVVISPFVFIRYNNGEYLSATLDTVIVSVMLIITAYVLVSRKTAAAGAVLAIFAELAIVGIVYLQGPTFLIWVYPATMAAFYLLPVRGALVFSSAGMIALTMLVYGELTTIAFVSFIASFVLTIVFCLVFIKTIQQQSNKNTANQRINNYRNAILELMVQSTPLSDILQAIVKSAEIEFPNIRCGIYLVNQKHNYLIFGAAQSLPEYFTKAMDGLEIKEGNLACGSSAAKRQRVIIEDISADKSWQQLKDIAKEAKVHAVWSEPIFNSKREVIGTFAMYHDRKAAPSEKHLGIIELFAQMASIAIEREQSTQLIWQQANFDALTKLPNRHMMQEHLQFAIKNCQRNQHKMAVIFLDLDHFKDINDTLGHEFGDLLLRETAKRIQNSIRKNDTVARLGGDEFVILINELKSILGAERIIEQLLEALAQPYHLKNQVVHCTASIGITIYPDDATDINTLLRNADQAMYGAKAIGRNNYHYFTNSMRESAVKRMSLINDLRMAVDKNEFFLVYQPIVDLKSQKLVKAEALIRWQHPIHGIVSPFDFIPLAEETGLIIEISDWLFNQVIKDITHWRNSYSENLQISINTSPRQYKDGDGNISRWLEYIKQEEINPKAIAFEITENLLMDSQSELEGILAEVKDAGIELSIDDFGTGYSSFSYLREFQTSYVKIDKSFVQKMSQGSSDLALCEAIIVMSQKLDIKVIAEGIETEEQKQLLETIGCDYGQGYLLSKPIVAAEFEKLL